MPKLREDPDSSSVKGQRRSFVERRRPILKRDVCRGCTQRDRQPRAAQQGAAAAAADAGGRALLLHASLQDLTASTRVVSAPTLLVVSSQIHNNTICHWCCFTHWLGTKSMEREKKMKIF